jgi:FkbM family methyltransferase
MPLRCGLVCALACATASAAAAGKGRRLATGQLTKGDGLNTSMLGGGGKSRESLLAEHGDGPWSSVDLASVSSAAAAELKPDPSRGQVQWLISHVFKQTHATAGKRGPPTFVEFGARDGLFESNSLLLELRFGWQGLLVEAGRDYIAALRQNRGCRYRNQQGACVFAALDAQANRTMFWHVHDKVLPALADVRKWRHQDWEPTRLERETTTTTLDQLFEAFGVRHVDFMSMDCEGCETAALRGLNLTRTGVDVLLVERPTCGLALQLAEHGYVALPLWFSYDTVFLSPRTVRRMRQPPRLADVPAKANRLVGERHGRKKAADLRRACPRLTELDVWQPETPWPPRKTGSARQVAPAEQSTAAT